MEGETGMEIAGVVIALMGFAIRYLMNRRRFNRRNAMGVEGFSSYQKVVLIRTGERLAKFIGLLFILVGILFFATGFLNKQFYEHRMQEKYKLEQQDNQPR